MPYLSPSDVNERRKVIKSTFPDMKFSITTRNYSTISIKVLEGPAFLIPDDGKDYESVNHYWIKDNYKKNVSKMIFLSMLKEIADKGNYIVSYDTDYGNWPKFYVDISIGKWDRPFKVKGEKVAA